MTHTLLPIAYAGPISHWIPICKEQAIVLEIEQLSETNLSESHGNPCSEWKADAEYPNPAP